MLAFPKPSTLRETITQEYETHNPDYRRKVAAAAERKREREEKRLNRNGRQLKVTTLLATQHAGRSTTELDSTSDSGDEHDTSEKAAVLRARLAALDADVSDSE